MALPVRRAEALHRAGDAHHARASVWLTEVSLLLMALIWGVNYAVVKFATDRFAPLAFNSLRLMLAAVSLVAVAVVAQRLAGPVAIGWPGRRDALALLGLGVLGNGIYQVFFVEGIARTRAGDAALVIASAPAFIALIGRLRGTERVAARGVAGIALSLLGIALVVLGSADESAARHASLVGDLLILSGTLCWSIYTVYLQPYTHRVSGLQLSALTMIGGAVPLLLLAVPSLAATPWTGIPAGAWLALGFSGIFALVIAYLFWYRGVRVIGPTRTAMYSNLQPIFAVIVAWLSLGETPTLWQGLGAMSIMSGLLLTRA
ncbi:MAG TPA: DMT family transporter [Gemmatimonadaceae bacterium]|nr:DMT family transporter [Gemmatimonadaceae bacterium]